MLNNHNQNILINLYQKSLQVLNIFHIFAPYLKIITMERRKKHRYDALSKKVDKGL